MTAYAAGTRAPAALMRMFERDKDESSAAARLRALGDPLLAAGTESAVRTLFAVVSDALTRRKFLHSEYYAMGLDRTELVLLEVHNVGTLRPVRRRQRGSPRGQVLAR